MTKRQYTELYYDWFPLKKNGKIKDEDILLLAVVSNLCKQRGYCNASNEHLSEVTYTSIDKVKRCLKRLEDNGIIRRETTYKSAATLSTKSRKIWIRLGEDSHLPSARLGADVIQARCKNGYRLGAKLGQVRCKMPLSRIKNTWRTNDNSPLKEKKRKDNIIEKEISSAKADASAKADEKNSSLLPPSDIFIIGRDRIIEIMRKFVDKKKFFINGLEYASEEYNDTLLLAAQEYINMDKVKSVDDVIEQLNSCLK